MSATTAEQRVLVGRPDAADVPEIGNLLLTARDGRPVYVRDVATSCSPPSPNETRVWTRSRRPTAASSAYPAVALAIAKRAGTNAVVVADAIVTRLDACAEQLSPTTSR